MGSPPREAGPKIRVFVGVQMKMGKGWQGRRRRHLEKVRTSSLSWSDIVLLYETISEVHTLSSGQPPPPLEELKTQHARQTSVSFQLPKKHSFFQQQCSFFQMQHYVFSRKPLLLSLILLCILGKGPERNDFAGFRADSFTDSSSGAGKLVAVKLGGKPEAYVLLPWSWDVLRGIMVPDGLPGGIPMPS